MSTGAHDAARRAERARARAYGEAWTAEADARRRMEAAQSAGDQAFIDVWTKCRRGQLGEQRATDEAVLYLRLEGVGLSATHRAEWAQQQALQLKVKRRRVKANRKTHQRRAALARELDAVGL